MLLVEHAVCIASHPHYALVCVQAAVMPEKGQLSVVLCHDSISMLLLNQAPCQVHVPLYILVGVYAVTPTVQNAFPGLYVAHECFKTTVQRKGSAHVKELTDRTQVRVDRTRTCKTLLTVAGLVQYCVGICKAECFAQSPP